MRIQFLAACVLGVSSGCGTQPDVVNSKEVADLPEPYATSSATKYSRVVGWPEGKRPVAPAGFTVNLFAKDLDSPRWIYVLANGDVLVAESRTLPDESDPPEVRKAKAASGSAGESANRITLLRDSNKDGSADIRKTVVEGMKQPFGMLVLNGMLYVAATDALWVYPFDSASSAVTGAGKKILDLPAGGYNNHWTRNLLASRDGKKIYVSVGSASNVGEHGMEVEERRACILEINPDGSGEVVYASGLRNPTAMHWAPGTSDMWTVVNERDKLGDNLVPDYLTKVRQGGFYGWPYSYSGSNVDPRRKGERPDLVSKAIIPDVALGSHTASLGMTFYQGTSFPARYRGGVFVAQHGSWNRSKLAGYKVLFVPFANGAPQSPPEDFLTGFIKDENSAEVYGRPIGIAYQADGSLLVSGDADGTIWKISAANTQ